MSDVATKPTARYRSERIRLGILSYVTTLKDIADAYRERDWDALGYDSYESYIEAEFSEGRLRLSTEDRRAAVLELRLDGMSQRAIGTALGVPKSTVGRDLSTAPDGAVDVTGVNGKSYASTRPTPTPGPVDKTPPVDPGATSELSEHREVGGSAGGPGENSTECACGTVFDGFDTHAEAAELLARHIETPEPDAFTSTAPSGSGQAPAPAADAPVPSQEPAPMAPPGSPATRTAEQVEANQREVERNAAVAACERVAESLVMEIRGMVTTIIDGLDSGAPGIPVSLADTA